MRRGARAAEPWRWTAEVRTTSLILFACAVGCAAARGIQSVAALESTDKSVGWAHLHIGMAHAKAQRVLGRELPIDESETSPACGSGQTRTIIGEHVVSIQWADEGSREIESLFVHMAASDIAKVAPHLRESLGANVTPCEHVDTLQVLACFVHPAGVVIWADSQEPEPGLRIILEDCTD